ncbi:MAG: DEAD/DEAH box helicase family protein [Clostridia bacterium]|nr:DEAD/DEAH box helicase family protein [Clostridia bacterium]
MVVAPCGSGKTTAAINTIAALASSPHKALFLIDTQNGNLRLA